MEINLSTFVSKSRALGLSYQGCVEEFACVGLYYPYHLKGFNERNHQPHTHSFEGLVREILGNYAIFSIEGLEEYYSKQELEFIEGALAALKNKFGGEK